MGAARAILPILALCSTCLAPHASAEPASQFAVPALTVTQAHSAEAWRAIPEGAYTSVAALVDGGVAFCSATYVGPGAVLTSRACARAVKTESEATEIVFASTATPPRAGRAVAAVLFPGSGSSGGSIEGCQPGVPDCGNDIAVVLFTEPATEERSAPTTRLVAGLLDLAATSRDKPAPMAITGVDLLLSDEADNFALVGHGVTMAAGRAVRLRSTAGQTAELSLYPSAKLCGAVKKETAGCSLGSEAVMADDRIGCTAESGSPLLVTYRKRSYLAGIVSRSPLAASGGCGKAVVTSLMTPRVVRWLTAEVGVPVVVCGADGRCEIVAGGQ